VIAKLYLIQETRLAGSDEQGVEDSGFVPAAILARKTKWPTKYVQKPVVIFFGAFLPVFLGGR